MSRKLSFAAIFNINRGNFLLKTLFCFLPGSWIRGDGGAVQRCPEEARLAVTPDLPCAQHCLQGRLAAVLLRTLLPPTLPGTRSAYTRLDYFHKRNRALVLLPLSPITARSVALSASTTGRPGDRAERCVQCAGRLRPAASPRRGLVQLVQRDQGVSRGKDCWRNPWPSGNRIGLWDRSPAYEMYSNPVVSVSNCRLSIGILVLPGRWLCPSSFQVPIIISSGPLGVSQIYPNSNDVGASVTNRWN